MSPEEVATEFIEAFCRGNLEALRPLLAEDFQFEGPFLRCETREEYLDELENDPPEPCDYTIIETYTDENRACVVYEYVKPDARVLIVQLTHHNGDSIRFMRLVFDPTEFELDGEAG